MSNISLKRILIVFTGLFTIVLAFLIMGFGLFFVRPAEKGEHDQIIIVREGMSLREVAYSLEREEVIKSKILFMLWARLMGYSRKIKAGEYRLSPSMAPIRILEILTRGVIITHPVTIPEGFSREQIAELLAAKGFISKQQFLALTDDPDVLKRYDISGTSLEGYLYPDTYQFGRGLSAESVMNAMINRFQEVIEPYKEKVLKSDMTVQEVVTLASIVEKETGRAEERPIIASVFLNRLKKRMRLDSDPTVIYGIKDFSGNLTRKDLSEPTPYNTYVIRGLPPGPIASPGLEAIKAVLYPAQTDYLYFVSKNDGSHYFSKTLKEHNRAVQKYQKRRRSR
ncbi:MAG: endolytic transglycosylase MltG [Deltaproteobacteria bacterium]|nr:endolytic transglycosylase MltG [Deltaproteobacteria bacterium]